MRRENIVRILELVDEIDKLLTQEEHTSAHLIRDSELLNLKWILSKEEVTKSDYNSIRSYLNSLKSTIHIYGYDKYESYDKIQELINKIAVILISEGIRL